LLGPGLGAVVVAMIAAQITLRRAHPQRCEPGTQLFRRALAPGPIRQIFAGGKVPYQLKTPYKNGTTHVVFEALDVLARLAALVPRPRVNLTRYHGVFAPNSAHRALVTRAGRGKSREGVSRADARTPIERHAAMRWAQRLKRVFSIDIETCAGCGGTMRIIACIEDPAVIEAILAHLAAAVAATCKGV
jgi:hypothetical protein